MPCYRDLFLRSLPTTSKCGRVDLGSNSSGMTFRVQSPHLPELREWERRNGVSVDDTF